MANSSQPRKSGLRIYILNRRAIACFILLVCTVYLIMSNEFWRWMYPIGYHSEIRTAARLSGVDPLLVASIIRVESKFQSRDVSHAGAIGLMQLMPQTAQWIAGQIAVEQRNGDNDIQPGRPLSLSAPEVNIRLGSWYVHYLTQRFGGNEVAAVAAYNAGPKRVQEWLQDGIWNGQLRTIADIPVGETRHFVDRVFYNYVLYKRIYGNDPAWRETNSPHTAPGP